MKNIKINNKNLKRAVAIGLAASVATGGLVAGCAKKQNDKIDLSSITDDQLKNLTFDELMTYLEDGMKKDNAQSVYDFLENFNGEFADSLKLDGDADKKFQITWDTAIAMSLGYNQYSATEMYEMYDSYDLKAENLYKLVKGYTTMSIPAYIRLTSNTGIVNLIDDEAAREFYLKYENKLIEMNQARFAYLKSGEAADKSTFEARASEFNKMIRNDFLNDSGSTSFGSLDDTYATGSRASVVPIISAAMDITRNTSSRLTDEEVKELNLDGYCNTIETNLKENISKLQTMQDIVAMTQATGKEPTTAESSEKEETTEVKTTIDIKYAILREAAIKALQEENKYFISDELSTLPIVDFNSKIATILTTQATQYEKVTNSYSKSGKTTTKRYKSRKDLAKDYPELEKDAKKQEKKISEKYSKENEANRKKAEQEASSIAAEKSKENEAKADQEIKNKNDNAVVKDSSGNSYDDVTVTKNSNVGDVEIDNNHTTTDNSGKSDKNFDGPIYDSNGNIIAGRISISQNLFNHIASITNSVKVFIKSR